MPIHKTPLIPARYYVKLIELLAHRNIPIEDFLKDYPIDLNNILIQSEINLPFSWVEKLIEFCLKFPKNRDLAFEFGRSLHLTSHHLVGYAVLTCETPEQALALVSKYFGLIMPSFTASLQNHPDQSVTLTIEPATIMSPLVANFHLEAIAVALHKNIEELLHSSKFLYHTFLSISEPMHLRQFRQLNGVQFYFKALVRPSLKAVFTHDLLTCQLPLADAITLKSVESNCQQQMKDIAQSQDIDEWVSMLLMNSQPLLTLSEIAQLLNISSKTLQRNLNKKNIDFRVLRNQVALIKAKQRLAYSEKSITEIAHELGYSSSSNFSRAFKASIGITPKQFKQSSIKS